MGHYDDAYDSYYAEMREQSRRNAAANIPKVVSLLKSARDVLEREARDINFAARISGEIEFSVAALSAQCNDNIHPDDAAVDEFAAAMKAKLAKKRAEGRGGWQDKRDCTNGYLSQLLVEHVDKGDPTDVANFCMMLHVRREKIADERGRYAAKAARPC